jgi:hypothetical protein
VGMNDTTTLKLYSPLTAELQIEPLDDDYYDEPDMEQLHSGDLVFFQEAILDGIAQEQLPGEAERGLMAYFHGPDSVNQKVESMKPTVEVVHGQLYGVAECRIKGALTEAELSALKDYCAGQYADGWGEGFEQRPRATGDGDLYVHFWQSKGFFLKTKQELERSHQLTPKEQYNQIAPLADPDGFHLYWTARTLTGIDVPASFHYEDNRGMFEAASGHTLLRYLTALRFDAVQWEIVGGSHEHAVLGAVDTTTPEYKAFEQKLYSVALERINRKRNVLRKSTQKEEMTR